MSGTESDYFEKGGGGCLMASLSRSLKYQTGTYFSTSLKSTCTWHEVHKRLFIFTYIYEYFICQSNLFVKNNFMRILKLPIKNG